MPKSSATSKPATKPKPDHHSRNTGPGKPTGVKTTAKQVTQRIRQAADLLCSGYRRSQITESMCKEYGVSWQMVSIYLRRARELLIEESGRPKQEHVAEVLGEYQQILRSKEAGHGDKLQALKGKREMLGLDAPKRAEISGPGGGKIEVEQKVKTGFDHDGYRKVFREVFGPPAPDGDGEPVHPARPDPEASGVSGGDGD